MPEDKQEDLFEFQVLGACFRVPGAVERFNNEVNPFDVGLIHGFTGIHEVYKALISYYRKIGGATVDPVAFKSWLRTENDIADALGGQSGVDGLIDKLMEVELPTVDAMVKLIEFRGNQRRQLDAASKMMEIIRSKGKADPADVDQLAALTKKIQELDKDLDYDPLSPVRTGKDMAASTDKLWESLPFIPTQFSALNQAIGYSPTLGGFMRGSVNAVSAASGDGKTTLLRSIVNYWLDLGETVLFVNFEEPEVFWERTLMTQVVKQNVLADMERLSEKEKEQLTAIYIAKLNEWGNRLMVRHDPESIFFEDLERWLRDILGRGAQKPTVVVIDTINSMYKKSGGHARWGQYEEMMVALEKLAKDMNAVFMITAQQSTAAVKDGREVLNQGDMGGSISILQKATIGFFITRMQESSGNESIDPNLMQIQIVKNRITGTAYASNPLIIVYNDGIKSYVPWTRPANLEKDVVDDEDFGATY